MCRHPLLYEQRRTRWVNAAGQPVHQHVTHPFTDVGCVLVIGGQRVPVRDEVKAFVLGLQPLEVLERPEQIAEVHPTARLHTAQYACGHQIVSITAIMVVAGR